MRNKIKQLLAIFISMIFLSESVLAIDYDTLTDSMKNLTTVDTFVEADGTTNYYSPSVSIRFNEVVPPGPLFSFTPPSMEVGCGGIDIKGMFMSIINFDELKMMLSNAGSTLAWGIAIGLIYSLPGVASAFKFINAWAKKIQQLLADACNAGQEVGRWIGETAGLDNLGFTEKIDGFIKKLGPEEYLASENKGDSALLEAMGWYTFTGSYAPQTPELSNTDKFNAMTSLFKSIFASDASMFSAIFEDIAKKGGSQFESTVGITNQSNGSEAIKVTSMTLNQDKVNSLASYVQTSGGGSLTGSSTARLALFSYVLVYNFVGDLGLEMPKKKAIENLLKTINQVKASGPTNEDQPNNATNSKPAKQLLSVQNGNLTKLKLVAGFTGMSSIESKARNLASFIWYGTSDGSATGNGSAGQTVALARTKYKKLRAPVINIYTFRDEDSSSMSAYAAVFPSNKNGTNRESNTDYYTANSYQGTILTSKCVIDALVDGNGTVPTTDAQAKAMAMQACGGAVIFPELHKYVKIIKDSPDSEQYKLKHELTQVMAIKMAEAILGSIDDALGNIKVSNGKIKGVGATSTIVGIDPAVTKERIAEVLKYRETVSNVVQRAGYYLDSVLGEEKAKVGQVDTLFIYQDRKNRQRGLQSLQK